MDPFIDSRRSLIKFSGNRIDRLLQGIITANINDLTEGNKCALYSLILNAKGRFLHDFFIIKYKNYFLIDCHKFALSSIISHIETFDVRKEIFIQRLNTGFTCLHENSSPPKLKTILTYEDPRTPTLGFRSIIKQHEGIPIQEKNQKYEYLRIKNCIADSEKDIPDAPPFPIECGLMHGVSFNKGCYIGQEITVLTQRKGVRRKLITVIAPDCYTFSEKESITNKDKSKIVGTITSASGNIGLCFLDIRTNELYTQTGVQLTQGNN